MNGSLQRHVMADADNPSVGIRSKQFTAAQSAHPHFPGAEDKAGRADLHCCLDIGIADDKRPALLAVEVFLARACDSGGTGGLSAYEARALPELLLLGSQELLSQISPDLLSRGGAELSRDLPHALSRNAVLVPDLPKCDSFRERFKDVAVSLAQFSFAKRIFKGPWFTVIASSYHCQKILCYGLSIYK